MTATRQNWYHHGVTVTSRIDPRRGEAGRSHGISSAGSCWPNSTYLRACLKMIPKTVHTARIRLRKPRRRPKPRHQAPWRPRLLRCDTESACRVLILTWARGTRNADPPYHFLKTGSVNLEEEDAAIWSKTRIQQTMIIRDKSSLGLAKDCRKVRNYLQGQQFSRSWAGMGGLRNSGPDAHHNFLEMP